VSWEEWLGHFAAAGLVFVFEAPRTESDGTPGRFSGAFYRVVSALDWDDRPLATLSVPGAESAQDTAR
jgi:hypothetical protein